LAATPEETLGSLNQHPKTGWGEKPTSLMGGGTGKCRHELIMGWTPWETGKLTRLRDIDGGAGERERRKGPSKKITYRFDAMTPS